MDNLNIKGIEDDTPRRRGKVRGKARKSFAIEARLARNPEAPKNSVFGREKWGIWSRYKTALCRDQAYAALVKKEATGRIRRWGHWEYRKRDDFQSGGRLKPGYGGRLLGELT